MGGWLEKFGRTGMMNVLNNLRQDSPGTTRNTKENSRRPTDNSMRMQNWKLAMKGADSGRIQPPLRHGSIAITQAARLQTPIRWTSLPQLIAISATFRLQSNLTSLTLFPPRINLRRMRENRLPISIRIRPSQVQTLGLHSGQQAHHDLPLARLPKL